MKVLEEFWYGNINPMERPFQSQRKFDKVFSLLTKNEEELLKNLNEQEKESIKKYNQGEALFVCGNRRMRIDVILTEAELDSFGSGGGL